MLSYVFERLALHGLAPLRVGRQIQVDAEAGVYTISQAPDATFMVRRLAGHDPAKRCRDVGEVLAALGVSRVTLATAS
jgi:hypothetical protein